MVSRCHARARSRTRVRTPRSRHDAQGLAREVRLVALAAEQRQRSTLRRAEVRSGDAEATRVIVALGTRYAIRDAVVELDVELPRLGSRRLVELHGDLIDGPHGHASPSAPG